MRSSHRLITLALLVALGAAACGGDDSTSEPAADATDPTEGTAATDTTDATDATDAGADALRQEYIDAAIASATSDEMESTFGPGTIECLAPGMVDVVGVETFQELGITPEDMANAGPDQDLLAGVDPTQEQAEAFTDVVFDCVDFGAMLQRIYESGPMVEGIDASAWTCVGDAIESDDTMRSAMVASILASDDEDVTDPFSTPTFASILDGCGIDASAFGL